MDGSIDSTERATARETSEEREGDPSTLPPVIALRLLQGLVIDVKALARGTGPFFFRHVCFHAAESLSISRSLLALGRFVLMCRSLILIDIYMSRHGEVCVTLVASRYVNIGVGHPQCPFHHN
jgi:hypothetical protein